MGSNPSTESNYKTAVKSKNKMQMLCMRPGTTAGGYNQGREPKNPMHNSMESTTNSGHGESLQKLTASYRAHGWELSSTRNQSYQYNFTGSLNQGSEQDFQANLKGYLHTSNARTKQQLRAFAPANDNLQKWYRMKALLKRSPTLPRTSKMMTRNYENSPEKLTVNSTKGFERRMKVGRKIAKYGIC
ncbi:hypothetical protein F511_24593 [Dorcoceras hygrometricum]|uniref:Uncharacterized protein n=1 Tax=Dorcoceras hygrometricum TaxID=472368 RepID=A0A2Z7BAV6_9LAMI|nr:hypothetical protein F511_24593 [Dorcoceras hygrometricum]